MMNVILRFPAVFDALGAVLLSGLLIAAPATAGDNPAVYTLQVDGLACPFCAYGIEKQLNRIDGVESVATDVKSGAVVITMKSGTTLGEADAKRAVEAAGFSMREFRSRDDEG